MPWLCWAIIASDSLVQLLLVPLCCGCRQLSSVQLLQRSLQRPALLQQRAAANCASLPSSAEEFMGEECQRSTGTAAGRRLEWRAPAVRQSKFLAKGVKCNREVLGCEMEGRVPPISAATRSSKTANACSHLQPALKRKVVPKQKHVPKQTYAPKVCSPSLAKPLNNSLRTLRWMVSPGSGPAPCCASTAATGRRRCSSTEGSGVGRGKSGTSSQVLIWDSHLQQGGNGSRSSGL